MQSFNGSLPGGFSELKAEENRGGDGDLLDQIAGVFFVTRAKAEQMLQEHLVEGQRSREAYRREADAQPSGSG